jgi:hypothetical protein
MGKYLDSNLKALPELPKFEKISNDFLRDIARKAEKWELSDRQIEAAKRAWDRIQNPPTMVKLNSEQAEMIIFLGDMVLSMQGRYASEFVWELKTRVHNTGKLTEKQYKALMKTFTKYKRAIMNRIFKQRR